MPCYDSIHLIYIPWTGWDVHKTRHLCTLKTKPVTGPGQSLRSTPNIGNPMTADAEHNCYYNLWKKFKNQHDSFINIDHALCTALWKAIWDQFKPIQKIRKCGFENKTALEIVDELFHTYDCSTATVISKIDDTFKTPLDPKKPTKMVSKEIKDAQIFALCPNLG